jgi:hypothetical protein
LVISCLLTKEEDKNALDFSYLEGEDWTNALLDSEDSKVTIQNEENPSINERANIRKTKTPERIEHKHANEESGLSDLAALE